MRIALSSLVVLLMLALAQVAVSGCGRFLSHEAAGHLTFASPQSKPLALQPSGGACDADLLLVASTTSNRVDVIETVSNALITNVKVGIEPVSVAFRPDGCEAWIANHVSDSVSVIDTNPANAGSSYLQVVETIQHLDANGVTRFDEPVGVAFKADGGQAYVALSSRNDVAIIDTSSYQVSGRLHLTAQEPRAIAVANGRLYVAAFESHNQSELSACPVPAPTGTQCSFTIQDFAQFVTNPNVPGAIKNIVVDPDVPDRDLFVWNIGNGLSDADPVDETVSGVGTLLYGIAAKGNDVYVTQTSARNAVNGIVGPGTPTGDINGDGDVNLADLDNRMFTNEVGILSCTGGGPNCSVSSVVDLDPNFPDPATALATPFGIALSDDGSTIVATAAGTNRIFTMSSGGTLLHRFAVGAIPRGVAFDSTGATGTAYVLSSLDNSVSVVNVGSGGTLSAGPTISVGNDPTLDAVRRGRIAFNDALASDSGTFSCASCHPDGNTDQLLWRIGGECSPIGCTPGEDEPRSTMPVRGLRDAIPLHWDGSLGDPFGAGNGSDPGAGPDCTLGGGGDQHACFRALVNASLSGVMCDQTGSCPPGGNILTEEQKVDMATFLERVSYPVARERPVDDVVSATGVQGFQDFFIGPSSGAGLDSCGDSNGGCHELPLGTSTNSETLVDFDAPTMRGLTDRFLQFSLGVTAAQEVIELNNTAAWRNEGYTEFLVFANAFPQVFNPVYGVPPENIFQMIEEASTGHSGALGRQVTLNSVTTAGCPACAAEDLLEDLEAADARGVVNLRGAGLFFGLPVAVSYLSGTNEWLVGPHTMSRANMIAAAQGPTPTLLCTLTAHLRSGVSEDAPQPLIAPVGAQCGTPGGPGTNGDDPALPTGTSFQLEGAHVADGDAVFLNGQDAGLTVSVVGTSTACGSTAGHITTQLLSVTGLAHGSGVDLLQIRSANGLLSNEMPLP